MYVIVCGHAKMPRHTRTRLSPPRAQAHLHTLRLIRGGRRMRRREDGAEGRREEEEEEEEGLSECVCVCVNEGGCLSV